MGNLKPRQVIDISGQRFGRAVVLNYYDSKPHARWECKCDCGNTFIAYANNLKKGTTSSCGCYNMEKLKSRATHKLIKTPFYAKWAHMKQRCTNPKDKFYKDYGGRGIKLCDRWLSFDNFKEDMYELYLKHKEMHGEKDTTLERIDVDGDYTPENCKFATIKEQQNNKRNNVKRVLK